jgi:signal transduction histidine kinase
VPDETAPGGIGGVLAAVHEITDKVTGERRLRALHDLGAGAGEAKTAQDACVAAARALAAYDRDVPFALLYLLSADRRSAKLASAAGVAPGLDISPLDIDLTSQQNSWPPFRGETLQVVEDLSRRFSSVPSGPWQDPPRTAAVVPIPSNKPHELAGLLIVGISARLNFDARYRSFLGLVAAQVATSIVDARAYEEEKRRAESLAELDRAKTLFFSNISHEFRTPLALMLGPIEDAAKDSREPLGRRQRERIELVRRNGLRLQKLVNSLLDFSRVEAGRFQTVYQRTDLVSLTEDLASNFRSAYERAGLTLTINAAPLLEPVYVDRGMWEKIVLNLLSNAFKFTFEGGITVSIAVEDAHAVVRFRDTGIGIPQAELSHIFERFHRVEGARGRTHEGTGIGLALVHELVGLHKGSIAVESTPGRGTEFAIRLPFGTAHLPREQIASDSAQTFRAADSVAFVDEALRWLPDNISHPEFDPSNEPEIEAAAASDGQRPAVLIADDNADMRKYIARLLEARFEVRPVTDGHAVITAARACRPEAIISDVMMPGLDGLGMLRALRADPELRNIPVILLSARAGEESRIQGLAAGADDYLEKPFSGRELVACVESTIKLHLLRRQRAQALQDSERKMSEEADALATLNELSSRLWRCQDLRQGLDNMLGAVVGLLGAGKGNIQLFNSGGSPTLEALSGFDAADAARFTELSADEASACARALSSKAVVVIEDTETDPDYDSLRLQAQAIGCRAVISAPLISGDGELQGVLTVQFSSIRRPKPQELRRLDLYLHQASSFISRCKAENSLREREEALVESDRLKNEFLALLGHELRNPLAPIYSTSEILSRILTDNTQAQAGVAVIQRQTKQLIRMVDDLLDVARISQGRISLRRQTIDLSSVVARGVETIRPLLLEKRHHLSIEASFRALYVSGDADRLAQCVSNLVSNAAKYTDPGGRIRIEVRAEGPFAVIEIADNGCGISAALLPRIFELFVQGDRTLDRAQGGLGIGLPVVKKLVEMHGGTVTARSRGVGSGSSFEIRLLQVTPAAATLTTTVPTNVPPRRIFIVDDNVDAAEALATLLQLDGHEVQTAWSSKEAPQRMESFRPDIALLDIGLPEMNGYELLRRLREVPALHTVIFIAITGYGRAEDRERIRQAGFEGYLMKPVSIATLNRVLQMDFPR